MIRTAFPLFPSGGKTILGCRRGIYLVQEGVSTLYIKRFGSLPPSLGGAAKQGFPGGSEPYPMIAFMFLERLLSPKLPAEIPATLLEKRSFTGQGDGLDLWGARGLLFL